MVESRYILLRMRKFQTKVLEHSKHTFMFQFIFRK